MSIFNPNPELQFIPIEGHLPCIVVDNFLVNPQALIDKAEQFMQHFTNASYNGFPGLEMRMPNDFSAMLNAFFLVHIKKHFNVRRVLQMYSRLSMVTLKPHELKCYQLICHRDQFSNNPQQSFPAALVYLFNNPALGGTSFFKPKISEAEIQQIYALESKWRTLPTPDLAALIGSEPAGYQTTSNNYFELIKTIPPAFNRAIFYDGSIFHTSQITAPELLSADPSQGRLTLNAFFICRNAA